MKLSPVLYVALGVVLFVVSMYLRTKKGTTYEIKSIDVVLVLLPVTVWLFSTGKIQKLAVPGLEVTAAKAFVEASQLTIDSQVAALDGLGIDDLVESVSMETKGGTGQIQGMIDRKTEALVFTLGHGGYWGPAIREYYDRLLGQSFLRYVVVNHADGRLFGVYDVQKLNRLFRKNTDGGGRGGYQSFAELLNAGGDPAQERLERLPGFIGADMAVERETTKREVLEDMEEIGSAVLPVVTPEGRFAGIVEQSRLVASLIIDVSKSLETAN